CQSDRPIEGDVRVVRREAVTAKADQRASDEAIHTLRIDCANQAARRVVYAPVCSGGSGPKVGACLQRIDHPPHRTRAAPATVTEVEDFGNRIVGVVHVERPAAETLGARIPGTQDGVLRLPKRDLSPRLAAGDLEAVALVSEARNLLVYAVVDEADA